jgi:hypothetical protein
MGKKRCITKCTIVLLLMLSILFVPAVEAYQLDLGAPQQAMGSENHSESWWASIQADIIRSEYNITWQEETYLADLSSAYQAPNRANNLRIYFLPGGPIIIPRQGIELGDLPPWRWEAQLASWGRNEQLISVSAPILEVEESHITYQRNDDLVESYTNTEEGLEQRFILLKAPGEGQPNQALQLSFDLGGDLVPQVEGEGSEIGFYSVGGEKVLRYGDLRAIDAAGNALPARISLDNLRLSVWIEDSNAVYPLQVAATLRGIIFGWDVQFGSEASEFGFSVATAGDVDGNGYSDIIVGAPYYDSGKEDQGGAFVYEGYEGFLYPASDWIKLSNQAGARFGWSVSTAGDVNGDGYAEVIVGAPYWQEGESGEGAAWVYYGSESGLSSAPGEYYQGNQVDAGFGNSVSTAGDVNGDGFADIIIGAPLRSIGQSEEGMAAVYYGSDTGLSNGYDWFAQSNQVNGSLGCDVATAGDINGDGFADIIVGASRYSAGEEWEGAAFIWLGSNDGLNLGFNGDPTNAHPHLQIDSSYARFGYSVNTAGDVNGDGYADVIVGAPYYTNGQGSEGGAWLYLGSSSGLNPIAANQDEGNQADAHFGFSVGTAGDVNGDGRADVIVGAPGYTGSLENQGQAYIWYGQDSPTGISITRDWDAVGESASDRFGAAVFTAGDFNADGYSEVIIGAPGADSESGAVYVYYGRPDIPGDTAGWTKRSNQANALFGTSVGTAGDVNGDGYADVIVGAPRWDGGKENEGGAWVYLGNTNGLTSAPHFHKTSGMAGAAYGQSVGTAGDVNGDGYSDVIIGAPYWSNPETNEGAAFVYPGSPSGLDQSAGTLWDKASDQAEACFGTAVGTAGDVNGDGYSDIYIGAPFWQVEEQKVGGVWLYYGSDAGPHIAPDWHNAGDQVDAQYGYAVSTAGDVNADGYSDVIIGSPLWEDDFINEGRAWLYMGSKGGLRHDSPWHAESNNFNARLGYAVGTAGDVDGDGYADVIVGAPYYGDDGLESEGKVWVFLGCSSGLNPSHDWSREGGQNGAYYGYSVGTAGDVNGDGYADVILGAPQMTSGVTDEGVARVYFGSVVGLRSSFDWSGEGGQTLSWYGRSVGSAGDVNGDGYADVIVGAPQWQTNIDLVDEGQARVYFGNDGPGVSLQPRQQHISHLSLAHLGVSDRSDRFLVSLLARTPFGRGRILLEVEVKPLGMPFNGSSTLLWEDSEDRIPGFYSYIIINNLLPGTPYHWRVRWRYDPSTTPWMPASRWVTMPWNGWNEQDLSTFGSAPIYLPIILR